MNRVSGQFQQFADPITIKLQVHSRFQSAFGGGFFRILTSGRQTHKFMEGELTLSV